ncbi:MAG: phosphomethylpyrimidine synthase ThiC [Candidatus Omnitrophica bacterium]|nr:phosphomethylpyrimidine synthase ThiC [Candidatus Omnitrophota bacterium]
MTQLEYAKDNKLTPLVKKIAETEGILPSKLLKYIREGLVVIPLNLKRSNIKKPCAIGYSLRTKVNANLGTSTDKLSLSKELEKLKIAVKYGADTVMDLSVGPAIKKVRSQILRQSPIPVGTVPIYELAVGAQQSRGDFLSFDADSMLGVLEGQAREGVDFFTVHCGVTRSSLAALEKQKRIMGIVSRGGAILASWISRHKQENPFYRYFDQILEIANRYDVTLSLGDGLRPGSICDATDKAQLAELKILGDLALRARRKNVQVMIEGPGHIPLDQIEKNIALEKKLCHRAPFYVLGPLVTDVAAGYDHITSAIGGALAASFGADFLCYVTASEHLRHPSVEDVREGVIASRIAAHAADIVKRVKSAKDWDKQMSLARKRRDWKKQIKLSMDPDKAGLYRQHSRPKVSKVCTMCGQYCSIKLMQERGVSA